MTYLWDTDTCIYHLNGKLIVVTNNTAHFQHVPELQIENWIL